MKKEIPIWGTCVPYNSSKSKYDDMVLSKSGKVMVILRWIQWVFGKKQMTSNLGHDDYVDRYIIQTGRAKATYEDIPVVIPYVVPGSKTSVVVAPGGGFCDLSMDKEGYDIAKMLNSHGISAFILVYRLQPYRFPVPCVDMQRAIRWVRHNAEMLGVAKNSVGAIGFSAGGYTAAGAAILLGNKPVDVEGYIPDSVDAENGMPDYLIPMYPVVSFDTNPNMLGNLKGPDFYQNAAMREQWKREYSLTDRLDGMEAIPQFFGYGTKDLLGGMEAYAEKLHADPRNYILKCEGANHGFISHKKWQHWETCCTNWILKQVETTEKGAGTL